MYVFTFTYVCRLHYNIAMGHTYSCKRYSCIVLSMTAHMTSNMKCGRNPAHNCEIAQPEKRAAGRDSPDPNECPVGA